MSGQEKGTRTPGTVMIDGKECSIEEAEAWLAKAATELGPRVLSPEDQKRAAFDAVAAMGLTDAQRKVLTTHYVTVGWKFLGRAMIGKSLEECSGIK